MNRKAAPPLKDAIDYNLKLKPYNYFELKNGVPVYTVNAGEQDVLQLEFIFFSGNMFEQRTGIAATCNSLLKNGTSKRNAFQLNEDFDYYGAYCNRSCFNETAVITLHTLSRYIDKLLPVVADMVSDSVFPESELSIYKQNAVQRLKVNLKKCEFVAGRLIDSYVYGRQHPYGSYTDIADIDSITREELLQFFEQYYVNGRLLILCSGKLPVNLQALLDLHFGALSLSKPTYHYPDVKAHPSVEKKFRIHNDVTAVQGAIRLATPFPNRHHPHFRQVMVLNTVFGGFFGSRLMSNIREDKGYTYGIHSYLQNHIQQSAWMIAAEAGKDVCEAAIDEVFKEMKILRDNPVDAEELLLVKNYMIGGLLGDLDGPFQIMARWKNIILNRLEENYFYESVDIIKKITEVELQGLANEYLHPEKFYDLVVY